MSHWGIVCHCPWWFISITVWNVIGFPLSHFEHYGSISPTGAFCVTATCGLAASLSGAMTAPLISNSIPGTIGCSGWFYRNFQQTLSTGVFWKTNTWPGSTITSSSNTVLTGSSGTERYSNYLSYSHFLSQRHLVQYVRVLKREEGNR